MRALRDLPRAARSVLVGRALRAFGDGFVSLLLPVYLALLGHGGLAIGGLIAATLLGSATATLATGLLAARFGRRRLLVAASLLMIATGIGFLLETRYWPLVVIGFIGTLNPSAGDVSLFVPVEHAVLADSVPDEGRTGIFALYALAGAVLGALGALAAGLPQLARALAATSLTRAIQGMFALYTLLGLATYYLYRALPPALDRERPRAAVPALGPSRAIVLRLAALFAVDAFAGGMLVPSLIALWLLERFGLSLAHTGAVFFVSGLLSAASYPASVALARRIGLVNTMAWTQLAAQLSLFALAAAPSLWLALAFLFLRSFLSQMDIPARTSYVMAVVTPPERPAAASMTLVPRSLTAAAGPLVAGAFLSLAAFPWALALGGGIKIAYVLLLLHLFRRHPAPEEAPAARYATETSSGA